jgi:hypothetical protein
VLHADAQLEGHPLTLTSIYAPNTPAERAAFFQRLPDWLPSDGRPLAVGVDFNCVASTQHDCVYAPSASPPASNTRLGGFSALAAVMARFDLRDVWRSQRPGQRDFTHYSASAASGARLDRWLISGSLEDHFCASSSIEPHAGIRTDHLPVSLALTPRSTFFKGDGLRSFPTRLFHHSVAARRYSVFVAARMAAFQAAGHVGPAAVDAWDQEEENCRLNAWTIYRACRSDDNACADKLACNAANARAPVALLGADPALVHAWQLACNAVKAAWYQRSKRFSGVAAALEHVQRHQPLLLPRARQAPASSRHPPHSQPPWQASRRIP